MGRKQIVKRNYDNEGNLISKECSYCHEVKPVSEFNKSKVAIDGLQTKCKECSKQYRKQYQKDNAERIKERSKEYYKDNAERIKERSKEYQKQNAESIKEYKKQYRKDNAEKFKEYHKEYYRNNAERFKGHYKEYNKQYYKNNAERIKQCRKDNEERIKQYQKEYYKDNVESIKEYHKEYYKEYKNKKIEEALQQIKIEVEADPNKYNYTESKEIYGIIYLVYNTESNKYYVGQTTRGFDNRYPSGWLFTHSYKNTVKHDLELYGENSFEYIKLFKVAHSQYELDKLEAYYIDYYNSYENGYNETRGNIFTDRGKEK